VGTSPPARTGDRPVPLGHRSTRSSHRRAPTVP
jgi:hypothetical protein